MAEPLMQLGDFQFSIDTAAYQTLKRTTTWRWPVQERLLYEPARQYIGPGDDTIELDCIILPAWRGGLTQASDLRTMAATGEALTLTDGAGNNWGQYVILEVGEAWEHIGPAGMPLKQGISLKLGRYGEDLF